uniref:Protein TsetseEP domain-containing protein n=1 Tax=Anopheles maculatus TaxID=74869 RepID=A0A182T394_9DIPT
MKSFIVLLVAIVGIVAAGRPETENVITTFKELLPLYKSSMVEGQTVITTLKSNVTKQLADLHLSIILKKEEMVQMVIEGEDYIQQQISVQSKADVMCLRFVNASSEMTVNLAGVSFTNCINAADEAIKGKVEEYYGQVNGMEQQVTWLRILDVFQGHNVFHSPQPIIEKLNAKLELLRNNNATLSADNATVLANTVSYNLGLIQANYNVCMSGAFDLLRQGLTMCEMQMTMICGATLASRP